VTFFEFLIDNNDKAIYVDPCQGNNGDELIWLGMQEALIKAKTKTVDTPKNAEVIVINGGGMFIDAYKQGINKIEYYSQYFSKTLLVIAPNSFYFKTVDFSRYLELRQAPMILFSREKYSKAYIDDLIKDKPLIQSEIDNDLVFHLEKSEFIKNLNKDHFQKGRVLVVDRMDIENANISKNPSFIKSVYTLLIPEKIKSMIRNYRVKTRETEGSNLTKKVLLDLKNRKPNFEVNRVITKDISRKDLASFEQFCSEVVQAEAIYTNRLHVGVLAHLLDREVYLIEGSYHKLTGIYEQSMLHKQSTKLLRNF
jgi:exopolysaccharide biosynthesis predicted pyruvyltransferase EpsI